MRKSLRLATLASAAVSWCWRPAGRRSTPTAAPTTAPATAAPATDGPGSDAPPATPEPGRDRQPGVAAGQGHRGRQAPRLDGPELPAVLVPRLGRRASTTASTSPRPKRSPSAWAEVGTDIAIQWTPPTGTLITAGGWGGRWDISRRLDERSPRPARRSSTSPTRTTTLRRGRRPQGLPGHTTLDELAGKTICVGAGTTYEQWLNGTLEIVDPDMTLGRRRASRSRPCRPTTTASRRMAGRPLRRSMAGELEHHRPARRQGGPADPDPRRTDPIFIDLRAPSRSTRAARRPPRCSRSSTRSSPTCMPTARCRSCPSSTSARTSPRSRSRTPSTRPRRHLAAGSAAPRSRPPEQRSQEVRRRP